MANKIRRILCRSEELLLQISSEVVMMGSVYPMLQAYTAMPGTASNHSETEF